MHRGVYAVPVVVSPAAGMFFGGGVRRMMATWRGAVLILAAAMAPGCVLLHPTDPYRAVAPSSLGASGAVRPEWDSLPEGPLTLAEATRIALANNPQVAAAGWDIGGLIFEIGVALFVMPCLYLLVTRDRGGGKAPEGTP